MKAIKPLLALCWLLCTANALAQQILPAHAKERYVQKALQLRKEENYWAAIVQLDSVLASSPNDAAVLLLKGDLQLQGSLFKAAAHTYRQLLPLRFEPTITQINLSYALFMQHRPAKALHHAQLAWQANPKNPLAIVNYFNALLWNTRTNAAQRFLRQWVASLSPDQALVLRARLYTTVGDYQQGLRCYDSLVKTYSNKYYVQEFAEVLLGKKELQQSTALMQAARPLFSGSEYMAYQQKYQALLQQNAGTECVFFTDIARNTRLENSVWWQQREGKQYRLRLSAGMATLTDAEGIQTGLRFGQLGITERWSKAWSGQTDIRLQAIDPANGRGFTGISGRQTIQYQPNDRRMIGVAYTSSILSYTASLLGKNIRSNGFGYVTNLMLSGKTGVYSQGNWAFISDKNQSLDVFVSLYHLFRTQPTVKTGLNFSGVHFKDNSIKTYFSPRRYLGSEAFVEFATAIPGASNCRFQLQAAAGLQKIEQEPFNPAYRAQAEWVVRHKRLEAVLGYQMSNVAAAVGTGYRFTMLSTKLLWKW